MRTEPQAPLAPSAQTSIAGAAWLAAVAAVVASANTLRNGFVYDDKFQILENRWLTSLRHLPDAFANNVWAFEGSASNYYRPLMHVSYILSYQLVGLSAWGFHAVNVLLHACASVVVVLLTRRLLRAGGTDDRGATLGAAIAGAVFAVHPIHTEVVAWVAGVTEIEFTLACLVALLLHGRPGAIARWGTAAALFVGLFAKETAIALPFLLVACDLSVLPTPRGAAAWARRYLPCLVALAVYAAIRLSVVPSLTPLRRHEELGTLGYVVNVFPLFAAYLAKLVVPVHLTAFHTFHPVALLSARGIASVLATVAFAGAALLAWRCARPALFGLVAIAAPLLPVLYIPALGENTFAERYLYLPSFGFVFLLGLAVAHLDRLRPRWRPGLIAAGAAICMAGAAATISRNAVWRDDFTLWTDTAQKSPDSSYVQNEVGVSYAERGDMPAAIAHYVAALRLTPDSARAENNLGEAYERTGDLPRAIAHYTAAVRLAPESSKTLANLGNAQAQAGALDLALASYREAVRIDPRSVAMRVLLGNALDAAGDHTGALQQYEAAVQADPESADAQLHLGVALGEGGHIDEAIAHLERASAMNPDDVVVQKNLAHARRLRDAPRTAAQ